MIKGKLLILLFVILVGCTSTNKKMETHPTNNKNALEALDKSTLQDTLVLIPQLHIVITITINTIDFIL